LRSACHQLIDERAQPPAGHQRRLEVPQRPGCSVARILKQRLSRLFAFGVHAIERLTREIDLAADLDAAGRSVAAEPQRNRPDGAHVRGDLLSPHAVAARGGAHQTSVGIGQRDADAVDLQLRDIVDGVDPHPFLLQTPSHALVEGAQFVFRIGVVETEHRLGVLDGLEGGGDAAADALRWGVGADQVGVLGLEPLELVHQRVELGVGELGIVQDVVALFVVADLAAEFVDPFCRIHEWP
jgi:hypothetical protein